MAGPMEELDPSLCFVRFTLFFNVLLDGYVQLSICIVLVGCKILSDVW